ncbi:hypothetical protein F5B22DRAFT_623543 [Xylaria bambusicola]|uniref:uncharacterized protein n=1 Tax=Xylaria bambusicola TaxID=326684 RepID=UPI0020072595|nr:uncharacterized protein F5B22DRAFT_623543 [Xylaria bambusicola]KAI0506434.1 hypothetical protein F5B22DRAFT_623543 [Xylaria bambusicola]
MAGRTRMQVGSAPWIEEERSSATQIAQSEVEEFTFSVQNDFDWLNEHMAEVFSENQINVAEIFKTPGKLRGKTPRTVRKANPGESRVPLSNIFSSTPKGGPNPFAVANHGRPNTPRVKIAVDPQPSPPKAFVSTSPLKQTASSKPVPQAEPASVVDSGYHGSQSQDVMEVDDSAVLDEETQPSSPQNSAHVGRVAFYMSPIHKDMRSPAHPSSDPAPESGVGDSPTQYFTAHAAAAPSPTKDLSHHETTTPIGSPAAPPSPILEESPTPAKVTENGHTPSAEPPDVDIGVTETVIDEVPRSPSDGSSPIRPIVRKSSLNFASLPAREPITHKSIGNRISRTSHLDQNRPSYYRHTGGKSIGHAKQDVIDDENDEMDIDDFPAPPNPQTDTDDAAVHSKTYTQRLQDQINKLGKPQANVQQVSKATMNPSTSPSSPVTSAPPQSTPGRRAVSPNKMPATPGAFPEDDDDWIEPLGTPDDASNFKSPRPGLSKSYTTDVMEGVSGKNTISEPDFAVPTTKSQITNTNPLRSPVLERTAGVFGHHKSVSVPVLPVMGQNNDGENAIKKTISVSNPPLTTVAEDGQPTTPKSPSRGFNNSPLKQVKNKLSSILKSSRGLLASSAAISAEGKSSLLSPSTTRLGLHIGPSTESLRSPTAKEPQSLYPDLSRQVTETQTIASTASPERTEGRRTRASIEREKAEEKRKKEEAKEARRQAEQMEKLEKAREKEREKARVFSKEQERLAAMEKQLAEQKEQEKRIAMATPANVAKSAKNNSRKPKSQAVSDDQGVDAPGIEEKTEDVEMSDAPNTMPPPSVSRMAAPSSAMKTREIKRPVRPTKETSKAKQAPTVIRVNMGSQQSHYHPSNSMLSSSLHDTLSQSQVKSKASQPSLQTKPSLQSLKSSTSSAGRPKALEVAARRKEQEEREAQRKRDAKAELDRKRAALQEEERRQEQQRKLEAEQQKEEERKQAALQAEAKKNAQRQAMLEKAKQTRAPPPAVRSQPSGPPDYSRSEAGSSRPPSRMNSTAPRSQDESSRPVNAVLSNASKAQAKRPLAQESGDDSAPHSALIRNGAGFQPKESKRMRMTDELNDPAETEKQPSLKGAPVRPSGGLKKDLPTKPMFPTGYTNAPSQNVTRDLFKATVTSQHNSHIKAAHPLDMAQVSKSAIPFASNTHGVAGSSKTPARPAGIAAAKSAAKSATRSSPRFQNGESIELPEINTDDEDDEDEDDGKGLVADWADSPNLRRALVEQENKNPFEVFGAPAPLNMEEVFARSKDRFPKFRARTSSANWSGPDGLTEEDIRKDLAARERMRREGGWSYDMGREMV